MNTWIFVRHGQSVANAEGWLSGHIDTPLTDLGREQARRCRELLAGRAIDRVFSSDLVRASETAALVWPELQAVQHPALRERHLGDHQLRDKAALRASGLLDVLLTWDGAAPGGESQRALAQRAVPWLAANQAPGTTLIVAHGGLIRVVLGLLDGVDRADIGRNVIDNAVPHVRQVAPDRLHHLAASLEPS